MSNANLGIENLSKEELLEHIRKLNAHVRQLKNVIKKAKIPNKPTDFQSNLDETNQVNPINPKRKQRDFDFSKYNQRHVAFKFFYLGWDYEGYVTQEDTGKTIENAVFDALIKTKLISDRSICNYHRCGRTDKGVSAFSQVISLDVRSNCIEGKGIRQVETSDLTGQEAEVNFCKILNKSLPPEIKFYAWAPVEHDFSARFDCSRRAYRYFFPVGSLDLNAMRDAANRLIGLHDFRNFSKLDRTKLENNYMRNIHSVKIEPFVRLIQHSTTTLPPHQDNPQSCLPIQGWWSTPEMIMLEIVGKAFLWHQIRCIVALLLMVGEGKESPQIVTDLLNIELYPQKPQYHLASELPLVLYECDYENVLDTEWIYDSEAVRDAMDALQEQFVKHCTKSTIAASMLGDLACRTSINNSHLVPVQRYLLPHLRSAKHHSIACRPVSVTQLSEMGEQRVKNNIKHRQISKMIDLDDQEKRPKMEEQSQID